MGQEESAVSVHRSLKTMATICPEVLEQPTGTVGDIPSDIEYLKRADSRSERPALRLVHTRWWLIHIGCRRIRSEQHLFAECWAVQFEERIHMLVIRSHFWKERQCCHLRKDEDYVGVIQWRIAKTDWSYQRPRPNSIIGQQKIR